MNVITLSSCRVVTCDDLACATPRSSPLDGLWVLSWSNGQATTRQITKWPLCSPYQTGVSRRIWNILSCISCVSWFLLAPLPAAPAGWNLVWSDEFDTGTQPDPARWDYDVGGQGWGNNELQFYTKARPENARIENGLLVIEARREKWENRDYTSARLVTKNRGDWVHGRFEIRAKVPLGLGTWPAIWMLPTVWNLGNGGWPDNGEIDIMEHVGYDPGVVHASTHTQKNQWRNKNQRTGTIAVPDAGEAFHTYVLEWDAEEIRVFVDDRHFFTSRKEGGDWTSWPFTRPFHLVLNVAVGGDWGGAKGVDKTIWPRRMEVDYVRVYQKVGP